MRILLCGGRLPAVFQAAQPPIKGQRQGAAPFELGRAANVQRVHPGLLTEVSLRMPSTERVRKKVVARLSKKIFFDDLLFPMWTWLCLELTEQFLEILPGAKHIKGVVLA